MTNDNLPAADNDSNEDNHLFKPESLRKAWRLCWVAFCLNLALFSFSKALTLSLITGTAAWYVPVLEGALLIWSGVFCGLFIVAASAKTVSKLKKPSFFKETFTAKLDSFPPVTLVIMGILVVSSLLISLQSAINLLVAYDLNKAEQVCEIIPKELKQDTEEADSVKFLVLGNLCTDKENVRLTVTVPFINKKSLGAKVFNDDRAYLKRGPMGNVYIVKK